MKIFKIALGSLLPLSAANADLATNLVAYYDFEQTGAPGLANKAPGADSGDALRGGTLHSDWAAGENPTGPGFAGKEDYTGISGTSDRSLLIAGNALNLDDDRDEYVEIPLGSTRLGGSFSISVWHALTPGNANASNRYHVFESGNGYDISWGTAATSFTAPQPLYPYLAYVGEGASFGSTSLESVVWNNVVHSFTSDGTTTTLRLFLNGEFVASSTVPSSAMDFPSILLGRHRTTVAQDRDWDGMLDEVGVWDRALSASEAKELFLRGAEGLGITADLGSANKAFISLAASPEEGGIVLGTELYEIGTEASIQAFPAPGYLFGGWSGAFQGRPGVFGHTVAASVESVASFLPDTADDDNDGLSNFEELVIHFTVPDDADTDDDGISDGDEIAGSLTDPLVSQEAAIQYILANLCDGGIQPGDIVLARDAGTNTLAFRLKAAASTTLSGWDAIAPSAAGVTSGTAGADFLLNVPGTSDAKRFFRFEVEAP